MYIYLITVDIWNAVKTNMTVCRYFSVDVIVCCYCTIHGMCVFRFCPFGFPNIYSKIIFFIEDISQ